MTKQKSIAEEIRRQRKFNQISFYITVVCFIAAIVSFGLALHQSDKIGEVAENITTRYKSDFPDCIDDINKLLEDEVKGEIIIMQDVFAYGMQSRPEEFKKLICNILKKRGEQIKITMLVYSDTLQREVRTFQYPKEEYENGEKKGFKNFARTNYSNEKGKETPALDRIQEIKKEYSIDEKNPPSYEVYLEMLSKINRVLYEELEKNSITIIPIDEKVPFYCWYNGFRAIFCFPQYLDDKEIAFETKDPKMLESLSKRMKEMISKIEKQY